MWAVKALAMTNRIEEYNIIVHVHLNVQVNFTR